MPDAGIFYCSNCTDNVRRTFESGQVVTMTEDKFWENPDIIQEIFIKLWGFSDMMPKRLNLKSYLYSMVRNRVFNFMRDNRIRLVNNYKIVIQNDMSIENEGFEKNEERLLSQQLDNAIDTLPPQQKQVAKLRRMGLSNREIAEKMNLSLNTVNIHHRKGVKALKKKLTRTISLLIILWIW